LNRLQATNTGAPGVKETGQHMSYDVVTAGSYAKPSAWLAVSEFQLHWPAIRLPAKAKRFGQNPTPSCSPACVWLNINNCKLCPLNPRSRI
jgi:hypothetical protein